jgi:hypothetical protein
MTAVFRTSYSFAVAAESVSSFDPRFLTGT